MSKRNVWICLKLRDTKLNEKGLTGLFIVHADRFITEESSSSRLSPEKFDSSWTWRFSRGPSRLRRLRRGTYEGTQVKKFFFTFFVSGYFELVKSKTSCLHVGQILIKCANKWYFYNFENASVVTLKMPVATCGTWRQGWTTLLWSRHAQQAKYGLLKILIWPTRSKMFFIQLDSSINFYSI